MACTPPELHVVVASCKMVTMGLTMGSLAPQAVDNHEGGLGTRLDCGHPNKLGFIAIDTYGHTSQFEKAHSPFEMVLSQ